MFKYFASQLWLVVICAGLFAWTANAANAEATSRLRSAYLGPSVWNEGLSSREVNDQLKTHFAEVLLQLESKNASGLLTALMRAEVSSEKRWSKSDRRAALIYLARNRQQQIKRLREYMHRGRFPLNEGQSPDAVPIFVDRHDTHCAVGYLMHSDGKDTEVAEIVNANNLVLVNDVQRGGMVQWIRTSGLTQEEAAMIQPSYSFPFLLDATFEELESTTPVVEVGGFTLSEFTIRATRFDATLPASFQTSPNAIDPILEQAIALLDDNDDFNLGGGVLFGNSPLVASFSPPLIVDLFPDPVPPSPVPNNLDNWLYIGRPALGDFPRGLVTGATSSGNVGIVEIVFDIQAEQGNFSQVALTSLGRSNALIRGGEQSALLLHSQIYDADLNELLGETRLFTAPENLSLTADLIGSESVSLNEDFLRIKTYGLVVGDSAGDPFEPFLPLRSFFNEFEVTTVPEPGSGIVVLLIGVMVTCRRNRRLISK